MKNDRLERSINYTFSDKSLLNLALSHRSVGSKNNERLEFLGDSLLNFIIAEALYFKFPKGKEGDLTRLRASLVKGETLAEIARHFDIGEYLVLGEGEMKSGGFRRASILADTVEAIIGAIYTESGMEQCKESVCLWYESRLAEVSMEDTGKDSKTRLQEALQKFKKPLPLYTVVETIGESHCTEFIVECSVSGVEDNTRARASSKRAAEQVAATMMLKLLGKK